MSTRALYSFSARFPGNDIYHVYKHHDGYPSGALEAITEAQVFAWPLPRFEADEFSAAFVRGAKNDAGGTRLLQSGPWQEIAPPDLAYRYEISPQGAGLLVTAYRVDADAQGRWTEEKLFSGTLPAFHKWLAKQAA